MNLTGFRDRVRGRNTPQKQRFLGLSSRPGAGHFGKAIVMSGDGQLAANRFLGEEGRSLHIEPDALKELRRLNSGLVLDNPTRVQRIFAAESV